MCGHSLDSCKQIIETNNALLITYQNYFDRDIIFDVQTLVRYTYLLYLDNIPVLLRLRKKNT